MLLQLGRDRIRLIASCIPDLDDRPEVRAAPPDRRHPQRIDRAVHRAVALATGGDWWLQVEIDEVVLVDRPRIQKIDRADEPAAKLVVCPKGDLEVAREAERRIEDVHQRGIGPKATRAGGGLIVGIDAERGDPALADAGQI